MSVGDRRYRCPKCGVEWLGKGRYGCVMCDWPYLERVK